MCTVSMSTGGAIMILWMALVIRVVHGSSGAIPVVMTKNEPPTVSKQFNPIVVRSGNFYKQSIDGHFKDDHDTNLTYRVENVGKGWIFVAQSDLCMILSSQLFDYPIHFTLIAKDSGGLTVRTNVTVNMKIPPIVEYNHWPYHFKFSFAKFPNWREIIYNNVSGGDNASFTLVRTEYLKIKNIMHVSVVYLNETLGDRNQCPLGNIAQVAVKYRRIYPDFRYTLNNKPSCRTNYANNSAPIIQSAFKLPIISNGALFEFRLPDDFCYDPEEGNIWTGLVLEDMEHGNSVEDSWLQFSSSKHTLFGVYVTQKTGARDNSLSRIIRVGKYKLICQDSFGLEVDHVFDTWIAIEKEQFSAEFRLHFTAYSLHPLGDFFEKLSIAFHSSTSQIRVKSYTINPLRRLLDPSYHVDVSWFNKSNPGPSEATKLRNIFFNQQGKLRQEVEHLFTPQFDTIGGDFVTIKETTARPTTAKPARAKPEESPPLIVKQPPREVLFEGTIRNCNGEAPVTIDCEAEGKPAPTYTWFKDGRKLQWEASKGHIYQKSGLGTLVITAPSDDDAGTYECNASNKLGVSRSVPAILRKKEQSSIKGNETTSVTAEDGLPFKLSCGSFHSSSKIRANWVLQNTRGDIKGMDPSRIIVDPEGHLWFFKVRLEDQSKDFFYVCMFSYMYQNDYQIGNRVFLNVVPKNESTPLVNQSLTALYTTNNYTVALKGHDVELCCIFAGLPLPNVSWSRGGVPADRALYENNGTTLRIKNVDFSDNGTYSCKAANGVAPPMSHNISLFVNVVPYFTEEPEIVIASKGETAELRCQADGWPLPEIKWIHNGSPFNKTAYYPRRKLLENGTIVIENLTKEDTGNYGCNATNSFSYVYKEVYVNVIGEDSEDSPSHAPAFSDTYIAISSTVVVALVAAVAIILVLWKKYKRAIIVIHNLSKEDVEEFYCGKSGQEPFENGVPVEFLPFMENKKIKSEDLEIESEVLGVGVFGIVYKGKFRNDCVAVKSCKSGADIEYFKAFLQELKLMAYIDEHENIFRFYGAVLDKIEEGICSAVMEFSPFGNLNDYLRIHSKEFSETSPELTGNTDSTKALTSEMLLHFCKQIAAGMEFLANKNVVHGDLASRNVLVYENGLVKVTDFGLSRKLYGCAIYTKKQQVQLPYRWMAIESLRCFEFSTQSDVWSFGVTAWEIFSLSQVPFPNLQWTNDLADKLESGLRLSKPKHCNPLVYDWMMRCWATIPHNRPTFTECKTFFSSPCGNGNHVHSIDRIIRRCDSDPNVMEDSEGVICSGMVIRMANVSDLG